MYSIGNILFIFIKKQLENEYSKEYDVISNKKDYLNMLHLKLKNELEFS